VEQLLSEEKKVVVFKIETEEYATGIGQVERILEFEKITRIPDAPDFLMGVINYQGRIIPVIDLKRKFNLPGTNIGNNSKIIIAKHRDGDIGLVIDDVSQVIDVTDDMLSSPPEIISGIVKEYIKGIIKLEKRIVIYLDMARILSFNERKALNEALI
jgi:purine-binding chemotaxis protein CheW